MRQDEIERAGAAGNELEVNRRLRRKRTQMAESVLGPKTFPDDDEIVNNVDVVFRIPAADDGRVPTSLNQHLQQTLADNPVFINGQWYTWTAVGGPVG